MKKDQKVIETPEEIMQMASAFQKSRIFLTAYELGIFSVIGTNMMTYEEVAEALQTDAKATGRLMNALTAMGFLKKKNGLYTNNEATSKFLVKNSSSYMSGMMHLANLWDTWDHLTETVKKGRPPLRDEINERGEGWLRAFINAMHSRGIGRAKQVAQLIDLKGVKRILDIGGGSGIFAYTFLRQNDKMSAVIFDLPNVVPITKEFIDKEGMTGRVETLAGNYLKDDIGSGYDMIFLSAVIHSNSFDDNKLLVKKCADALNPGGKIVILDYVMNEERTEPMGGTIFAINMLVGTQMGDTYTEGEITDWIKASGLGKIEVKEAGEGGSLVIASKPA